MKTTSFPRALFVISLLTASTLPFSSASNPLAEDCLPKDPPPPVVKLKVRVPARGEPGQPLEYRICVENCSTAEAHHVLVKNVLPTNAKFVRADPEPTKQGPELQWNLGTIGGGATREIILTLQPTSKDDVKNCVRVQFEHGLCTVTRQSLQPGDRPFVAPVPDEGPNLELKATGPVKQFTNLPAKYELTLTNKGKTRATNTLVNVRLPEKLKLVKASDPHLADGNLIVWVLGHLEPGASKSVELTLKAADKGEHCFLAAAKADQISTRDIEVCTTFAGVSALSVEMIGRDGVVFVGGKTSYPVKVQSLASDPVTNVEVRAFIPEGLKLERASSAIDELPPEKGGQWIRFKTLPKLEGGKQASYEVFVEALKAGVTRFHVEIAADQLDKEIGPVREQEITNVVDDSGKAKLIEMSRPRK